MLDIKSIQKNDFYGLLYFAYVYHDKTDEYWDEHIFCLNSLQINLAVEICRAWAKENTMDYEELLNDEQPSALSCFRYILYGNSKDTDMYLYNIAKAFNVDLMRICGDAVDELMQAYAQSMKRCASTMTFYKNEE